MSDVNDIRHCPSERTSEHDVQREEMERKLYERRREMWDAEKALKNELKRGEIGFKPHEMPARLQHIVDGFGRSDDDRSFGE